MPLIFMALLLILSLAGPARAAAMYDPDLAWQTLETPHFRVNYPESLAPVARKAAQYAEEAHARLTAWYKLAPAQRTEVTLFDDFSSTNGFAFPYPVNQILLFGFQPGDDAAIRNGFGRYDSYLRGAITHEYTHILQMETTGGLVSALDRVFGRVMFPNMTQPKPLIEGLAVHAETRHGGTSLGRSATYEMVVRTACAAGDRLMDISQASSYLVGGAWPPGADYIYGSYFYTFLEGRYGPDAPRSIADNYGTEPWFGIDRAVKKAVGHDTYQVWEEFTDWLRKRFRRQIAQIRERPETPYQVITSGGQYHQRSRFLPDGTLVYGSSTGDDFSWAKAIAPDPGTSRYDAARAREVFGKRPSESWSTTGDGRLAFYVRGSSDGLHAFSDLFRYDFKTGRAVQLTSRQRASDPAVSPDGGEVMAVVKHRGRSGLSVFDAGGTLLRSFPASEEDIQYSSLQWSPDRSRVAASVWEDGTRDLAFLDPASGSVQHLWRDLAADVTPAWSPDGRYLLFASDRTGVFNLHAVRLADRKVFQVTHVLTGAVEPAVSPDRRTVAFSVYTARGWEIATMSYEPDAWQPAVADTYEARDEEGLFVPIAGTAIASPPPAGAPPDSAAVATLDLGRVAPYDPWQSLRPKFWLPNLAMGDEGGAGLGVTLISADILLEHQLTASVGIGLGTRRPQYVISYVNDQLPPTLSLLAADYAADYVARGGGMLGAVGTGGDLPAGQPSLAASRAGTGPIPFRTWRHETRQAASVTYPGLPHRLLGYLDVSGDFFTLGWSRVDSLDLGTEVPPGCGSLDLARLPGSSLVDTRAAESRCLQQAGAISGNADVPVAGVTSIVSVGYRHSDNYRFSKSISSEGGSLLALEYEHADPAFDPSYALGQLPGLGQLLEVRRATFDRVTADLRTHLAGFAPRHVWALRLTTGANMGGRDGAFSLGGNFATSWLDIVDARAMGPFRAVPLRGYPPAAGDRVAALNVEYRFPLGETQRSLGTLPLFFDRWYGAWLYDVGNVWSRTYPPASLRQSVGFQVRAKLAVVNVPLEIGAGIAQGITPPAEPYGSWQRRNPTSPSPEWTAAYRYGSWRLGDQVLPAPEIFAQIGTSF